MVYYVIRYLQPKENGPGTIVFAVSSPSEITLVDLKAQHPDKFSEVGFYSLMQATGETLTVQPEKSK